MSGAMGRWLVLPSMLLLVVSALPVHAEKVNPYVVSPEGITYYLAFGDEANAGLEVGFPDGPHAMPFQGCAIVQLRPDLRHGVVRVVGTLDNDTEVRMNINDIASPGDGIPSMATDVLLKPTHGEIEHAPVPADIEAWGQAKFEVNDVVYPDPVTGNNNTQGHVYVTPSGFRDDASGKIAPPGEDTEIHVHLSSLPGAANPSQTLSYGSPPELPDGSMGPHDLYQASYSIPNKWYGGQATIHIKTEANAPQGSNSLTFAAYAPQGSELGNKTLTPYLQTPASADFSFPLGEFGTYFLSVEGKVALSKYSVTVDIQPPSAFSMDFWWNKAVRGAASAAGNQACKERIGSGLVGLKVGRPAPPPYNLESVVVGIGATSVGVILIVNLIVHRIGLDSLRKRFRN